MTPTELVNHCKKEGLTTIAITDHDTVDHIEEAMDAGRSAGVDVFTGTELTVEFGGVEMVHLLAYDFDEKNKELCDYLKKFQVERDDRSRKMIANLQKLGLKISWEELQSRVAGVATKRHVKNLVYEKADNLEILQRLGVASPEEFSKKLTARGKPADPGEWKKIDLAEAVKLVKGAGGSCSIAHPAYSFRQYAKDHPDYLAELKMLGVDAIEVFYGFHTKEEAEYLFAKAKELKMSMTAGSDFHEFYDPFCQGVGRWNTYGLIESQHLKWDFFSGFLGIGGLSIHD